MRRMQGYVSDAYSESNLWEIWDKSSLRDTSTKWMACNLPKCPDHESWETVPYWKRPKWNDNQI